jgi:exodeoxyribonuclease-5
VSHLHLFYGKDEVPPWLVANASSFDFGDAITCHVAQGSEWPSVYVFDESQAAFTQSWRRHLYTAVTRASQKLIVARP